MTAQFGVASAVAIALMTCAATAQDKNREFNDLSRRAEAAQDVNPADAAALYRRALAIRPAWAEGWLNSEPLCSRQAGIPKRATHSTRALPSPLAKAPRSLFWG